MTLIQIFSFTIILIIVISFPPCLCTEREKSEDLWSTDVNLMWKWIDSQMEKGKLRNSTRNRCKVDTNAMRPLKSRLNEIYCNITIITFAPAMCKYFQFQQIIPLRENKEELKILNLITMVSIKIPLNTFLLSSVL